VNTRLILVKHGCRGGDFMGKKSHQKIQFAVLLLSTTLAFSGCQPPNSKVGLAPDQSGPALDITQLPDTLELPEVNPETEITQPVLNNDSAPEVSEPTVTEKPEVVTPVKPQPSTPTQPSQPVQPIQPPKPTQPTRPAQPVQPATKPEPIKPPVVIKSEPSEFIKIAHEVMVKEGKKIGTPCNFYVRRVLMRAGYKDEGFLANDFDVYAKKNFISYKAIDFKIDKNGTDKAELKKYIWSYPERTPFIAQWTRPGNYGHVAIIERAGDDLVIYQASINQYTARRDLTTVDRLLSSQKRAFLTLYSEFKKK